MSGEAFCCFSPQSTDKDNGPIDEAPDEYNEARAPDLPKKSLAYHQTKNDRYDHAGGEHSIPEVEVGEE